jgi:twitching motility protein PilT
MIDAFPAHQQTQVRMQLASVLRAVVTQVLVPTVRPPARVPAIETLVVTTAVATKIRDSRGHQLHSEIHKGRADGMISLEASLGRWVKLGRVAPEVAARWVADPALLRELSR